MWGYIIKGALLGGLIANIWSALWWTVIPFSGATLSGFENEDAVARVIMETTQQSGVYFMPDTPESDDSISAEAREAAQAALETKMKQGPVVLAVVQREGFDSFGSASIISLLIHVVVAALLTWLLLQTGGLSFGSRTGFIAVAALAAGIITRMQDWNWWGFTFEYTVVSILGVVIGWLLAGLAIAHFAYPHSRGVKTA